MNSLNAPSEPVSVLVTGAGSGMGFDAIRLLSTYTGIREVSACNVTADCPARALVKQFVVSPDFYFAKSHSEEEFIAFVIDYVEKHHIDVVIPLSIFELHPFAKQIAAFTAMNTRVIVESVETIRTLADKLASTRFLQSVGGYSPDSEEIIEDDNGDYSPSLPYPVIVKPRYGYGSKAIKVLYSQGDFEAWRAMRNEKYKPYIAQTYLPSEDKEYTCSILYGHSGKPLRVLAMRRLKMQGITLSAVYDSKCHDVEDYLLELAPKLGGQYCLNAQLRVENGDPYVFEINPRFSSSEPLRRLVGHDSYLQILGQYYAVHGDVPPKRYGMAMRVYAEVFLSHE